MSGKFLSTHDQPFCKGCGHNLVGIAIEKALTAMDSYDPLDLVVVTDIGCIGIIDKQFRSHTVHGLHGRSAALATGISMGLTDPSKKILVLLGDGGATIGLQHILEAARMNINMTVIVHNNMLYGMTGGQPSGLTPMGFRTQSMPDGRADHGMDLCRLVHTAGAAYARRFYALGDFSQVMEEAFSVRGFSLLEAVEICPSHGVKFNPGKKLDELTEPAGLLPVLLENRERPEFAWAERKVLGSLFDPVTSVETRFSHSLNDKVAILLAGSAGEGVQSTAEILATAAMSCGLQVTKKGSYPVTVGVGFSLAELIISPGEIDFTGIGTISAALVTSGDGLKKSLPRISSMTGGSLFLDSSLVKPGTSAETMAKDYRKPLGARSACLLAAADFVRRSGMIPMEAFLEAFASSRISRRLPVDKLREALEQL